jgi:hypothetical protein
MSVDESLLHQSHLGDRKLESFSLNSWSQVRNIPWRVLDKAPYGARACTASGRSEERPPHFRGEMQFVDSIFYLFAAHHSPGRLCCAAAERHEGSRVHPRGNVTGIISAVAYGLLQQEVPCLAEAKYYYLACVCPLYLP